MATVHTGAEMNVRNDNRRIVDCHSSKRMRWLVGWDGDIGCRDE